MWTGKNTTLNIKILMCKVLFELFIHPSISTYLFIIYYLVVFIIYFYFYAEPPTKF